MMFLEHVHGPGMAVGKEADSFGQRRQDWNLVRTEAQA
jgi:hypothetical protein